MKVPAVILLFALLGVRLAEALNLCSAQKMWANYDEMRRVSCRNCDKYFHCQGNYEAVYSCTGFLRVTTAATISNMREWYQDGGADSEADQIANRYGRGGGNCGSRYLRSNNCAYNPRTRECKW